MKRYNLIFIFFVSFPIYPVEYNKIEIGNGRHIFLPMIKVSEKDNLRLLYAEKHPVSIAENKPLKNMSLRYRMTPSRDQGKRGTCNTFVALGLIEFYEGGGNFSEQCLAKFSSESDSNVAKTRINWAVENGLYYEADCPYDMRESGRGNIPDLSNAAKFWPGDGFTYEPQDMENPIEYIKNQIDSGNPVSIDVFIAGDDWQKQKIIREPSEDDIKKNCKKESSALGYKECAGHGVIVTGYDDQLSYLEFKNSWGENWPEGSQKWNGYGQMSFAYFMKMRIGINKMVSK